MNESASLCSSRWTSLPSSYIIPRFIIIFIGAFSNILLLIGIMMDPLKCFKNSSSYLIMNLSITDILTCLVWLLIQYWPPCVDGQNVYPLIFLAPYVALLSIVTMDFDRYMSCVHPFKYRILITRNVTLTIIVLQWLFSSVHLVLEMAYRDVNWQIYSRATFALSTLLSGAIMYSKAAYVLKKQSKYLKSVCKISSAARNKAQHVRLINEKRLLTTMFLVSFITITTVAPVMIYVIIVGETFIVNEHLYVSNASRTIDPFHVWLPTLLFVNFSINPFMYTWRLKNYRKTLKALPKRIPFC